MLRVVRSTPFGTIVEGHCAMSRVVVCSIFRDSAADLPRFKADRMAWTYPREHLVHLCLEGDSKDDTFQQLKQLSADLGNVDVRNRNLGNPRYPSVAEPGRLEALSVLDNTAIEAALEHNPEYILWLESDIRTPPNLIERLMCWRYEVVAPLVLIEGTNLFYDCWAYRAGGNQFVQSHPYCSRSGEQPFEVESAGSTLLIHADIVRRGARFTKEEAIVGFCRQATGLGHHIWVDPTVTVYHPQPYLPPEWRSV